MTAQTFLGIDAGGTHTDAVLCGPEGILAGAKAPTCHEDLPSSVRAALAALEKALEEKFGPEGPARLRAADRVTVVANAAKDVKGSVRKNRRSTGLRGASTNTGKVSRVKSKQAKNRTSSASGSARVTVRRERH